MRRIVTLSVVLFLLPLRVGAVEVKKDGWRFPDPARATKKAIRTVDTTARIPGRETLVKIYRQEEGVIFETLEIEGEVFAFQFHVKGKDGEPPTIFAIVDTDGDGIFESKYGAGERPETPDWPIRVYYNRHPEWKDPGSATAKPR